MVLLLQEVAQLVLATRHRPVLVQNQLLQVTDLPTSKYLFSKLKIFFDFFKNIRKLHKNIFHKK